MSRRSVAFFDAREHGFALPIVLVFMVVASLTAFFAAKLTRSDMRGVNNLQNEKEALTIAEAGVHEALYRLNLTAGNQATVPSVNGGSAFNAAITPQTGASWNAQILFTTFGPLSSGTAPNQQLQTPSLQPVASRMAYSTSAGTPASETLSIAWDVCTATATSAGCSASGAIRKLPLSDPRSVVKISATGASGAARRKVTVWAVDVGGSGSGGGPASLVALGNSCSDRINITGNSLISATGAIQVNAGAGSTPPSSCTSLSAGGGANVTAASINLVGDDGSNLSPAAQTGVLPMTDPLSSLQLPCFSGYTGGARGCQNLATTPTVQNFASNATLGSSCTGTAASPTTCSPANNATLNPGIYYGGLNLGGAAVLNPGTYIMAGGGYRMGGGGANITSASGGVTIVNTLDPTNSIPAAGQYGNFSLGVGNATATIRAPTSGPYEGIVFIHEPDPSNSSTILDFQGGTTSNYTFDGVIYAPNSRADLQGNTTWNVAGNLIVRTLTLNGGSDLAITNPSTPCPGTICAPGGVAYTPIAWQDF